MIENCLYKIEREIPGTRRQDRVQSQLIIVTNVTTEDSPEWVTEEDSRRTCVATTATSMAIIPGTASFQRGQERNKDLRSSQNCQDDILGGGGGG